MIVRENIYHKCVIKKGFIFIKIVAYLEEL